MDISRAEQRILHLLAQGGRIDIEKDETKTIVAVICVTREGWRAGGLDVALFRKLKRRRCIASSGGRKGCSAGSGGFCRLSGRFVEVEAV